MAWTVYVLKCADKSLYTGITLDLERRLEEHATGKGPNIPNIGGRLPWCSPNIMRQEARHSKGKRRSKP